MNKNWLRVFRPKEVFPGAATIILAALDTKIIIEPQKLLLMVFGFLGIFFSAFLINELVDSYDTDKLNPEREKGITKHGISRKFMVIAFLATSLSGVFLLHLINLTWVALIGFTILFTYSAPVVRIKAKPFLELAFVTIGCALLPYLSYYILAGAPITWTVWLTLLFFATGFPAIQLVNEGADYLADKKAGIFTTAVFLGERNNLILMATLSVIGAISGLATIIVTGHWWYLYIVAVIFFLFTAARYGLSIVRQPERLHELLRTGERFGVFASDLGTIIVLILFAAFYGIKLL